MKQYKWNFDKLTALLVALINCIVVSYLMIRFMTDSYFSMTQTGFNLNPSYMIVIAPLGIAFTVFMNLKFIQKNHRARLIIAFAQTIGMACILRNLFVGYLYFGFDMIDYLRNLIAFSIFSTLIYHTLFSKHIKSYYSEISVQNNGGQLDE